MKKLIMILSLASAVSCIGTHRVDVWKTMTIPPGDSMVIRKVKAPATLDIRNQSEKPLGLISELSMQKKIEALSEFSYRLPKKSHLILVNANSEPVSIHLHYASNQPILVNNKELR